MRWQARRTNVRIVAWRMAKILTTMAWTFKRSSCNAIPVRSLKELVKMRSILISANLRSSISIAIKPRLAAKFSGLELPNQGSKPSDDHAEDQPPRSPIGSYPPSNPLTVNKRFSKAFEEKPRYRLHCHSTRNNTITTFTQPNGSTIAWFSGGSCGFKKGNRASYEAGYQCAVRMFKRIEQEATSVGPMEVELFFKGFGQGREALHKALLTSEGQPVRPLVVSITDRTPIKIGGTRAKKMRRL
jgi:small subunit ribosomal protein S11